MALRRCAWCGKPLGIGPGPENAETHGICEVCRVKVEVDDDHCRTGAGKSGYLGPHEGGWMTAEDECVVTKDARSSDPRRNPRLRPSWVRLVREPDPAHAEAVHIRGPQDVHRFLHERASQELARKCSTCSRSTRSCGSCRARR